MPACVPKLLVEFLFNSRGDFVKFGKSTGLCAGADGGKTMFSKQSPYLDDLPHKTHISGHAQTLFNRICMRSTCSGVFELQLPHTTTQAPDLQTLIRECRQ